jgi:hypothetical protein
MLSRVGAAQDPGWANRHTAVVLLTDGGGELCGGDPCGQAGTLYTQYIDDLALIYAAAGNPSRRRLSAGGFGDASRRTCLFL